MRFLRWAVSLDAARAILQFAESPNLGENCLDESAWACGRPRRAPLTVSLYRERGAKAILVAALATAAAALLDQRNGFAV